MEALAAAFAFPAFSYVAKLLEPAPSANVRVSALYIYPIKSCAGISVTAAEFDRLGFQMDRRFMVVFRESGKFVSQRIRPKMALIKTSIRDGVVHVEAPGMPALAIPNNPSGATSFKAVVWGSTFDADTVNSECDKWFSDFIGLDVVLLCTKRGTEHKRPLDPKFDTSPPALNIQAAFSDGFPFLLATEESLAQLNTHISPPVTMTNFRPNIVVKGARPWEEDTWKTLEITNPDGTVSKFDCVKPCGRCSLPTVDPVLGERRPDHEPTKTLEKYRALDKNVIFGENLVQLQTSGTIQVGAHVKIVATREAPKYGSV